MCNSGQFICGRVFAVITFGFEPVPEETEFDESHGTAKTKEKDHLENSFLARCTVIKQKSHDLERSWLFGAGGRTSRRQEPPCWAVVPRNTRLRAGIFSSVHIRKRKNGTPHTGNSVFWCRWPDSNRHAVASGGF